MYKIYKYYPTIGSNHTFMYANTFEEACKIINHMKSRGVEGPIFIKQTNNIND